jgi:hypothetical protein
MEVSWALGAGFHLLNSYHNQHKEQKQRELQAAIERDRQVFLVLFGHKN